MAITRSRGFLRHGAAVAVLLCALGLAAGCGTRTPRASVAKLPPRFSHAHFVPADFVSPTTGVNRYLPLEPGLQAVRAGTTLVGHRAVPHLVVSTITDIGRRIDGVTAVAVLDQDIDAGQISQESIDWRAVDKWGNVWSVGSYTEEYEGGRFSIRRDAWLAGIDGGKAGIMMPANPTP